MIDTYTSSISRLKCVYKLLKSTLPGAFTYIMPSSNEVPKMIVDRKHHRLNKWRRKEIGVRMPDDCICRNILESLHEPLLSGSVPQAAEDEVGVEYISSQGHEEQDEVGAKMTWTTSTKANTTSSTRLTSNWTSQRSCHGPEKWISL